MTSHQPTNLRRKIQLNIMPVCPQAEGQRCKGRPKNTLFVLPFCFWAKEKGRFFEAGAANPCQLWQTACNFAIMFWCIWKKDMWNTLVFWGGGRGWRRNIRNARAVKKTIQVGFVRLLAFLQLLHHWNGRRAAFWILLLPLKIKDRKAKYNMLTVGWGV